MHLSTMVGGSMLDDHPEAIETRATVAGTQTN